MNKTFLFAASSVVLLTACGSKDPDVEPVPQEQVQEVQEIIAPVPSEEEVAHPAGGLEEWFAIGPMNGVGDTPANGVAQAHYFEKGVYLLTIQLNIDPVADGSYYEAWISDGTNVIDIGRLNNTLGDSRHTIQFQLEQDLRQYLSLAVTKELDDGDAGIGSVVAEGTLADSTNQ